MHTTDPHLTPVTHAAASSSDLDMTQDHCDLPFLSGFPKLHTGSWTDVNFIEAVPGRLSRRVLRILNSTVICPRSRSMWLQEAQSVVRATLSDLRLHTSEFGF